MTGFETIIDRLRELRIEGELWVNGSFLTEKIDPEDVDVVLKVDSNFVDSVSEAQMVTFEWFAGNLRDHFCHSFVHVEWPRSHQRYSDGQWWRAYWIRQWGFSGTTELKGIALIELTGKPR